MKQDTLPHRLEPQYLIAAMTFWTNTNSIIWQQLAAMIVIQLTCLAGAYAQRGSIASIYLIAVALALCFAIIVQIVGNIEMRDRLSKQCAFITSELMMPFFKEWRQLPVGLSVPFILDDDKVNTDYSLVRHKSGTLMLFVAILVVDGLAALALNRPTLFSWLTDSLPLFPVTVCAKS